jgi:ATP-dependent helicase/DNAse subunit B
MPKRVQSPSSINTYNQCPRKYYYQYILKLPTRPSIHLVRGNIAHSVLEDFFSITHLTLESVMEEGFEQFALKLLRQY